MGERQDFIALDWVAGEIEQTLKQAAQALDAYIANRSDATKLRFCLTHIHQVHGTLQMVEFYGAALLAEEMEGIAHALAQGKIHESHVADALDVLKNAIKQLPKYIEKVKESRHGLPAALLPVLNDLRAVRGEHLLSETALFSPKLTPSASQPTAAESPIKGKELAEITQKLRQMYQIALLGFIRGKEVRNNLNYLAKVCARLVKLSAGSPSQSLWRVCIAVLEGLLNGSIEPSVAVKILLRQIDRQIKLIVDNGEAALQQTAPQDLLKNLLYYIARSKASSKFINEIKSEYNLEESLLGDSDLGDDLLNVPNSGTLKTVIEALSQELTDIKSALQEAGRDSAQLTEVLPLFRRVCDTMAILGLGQTLKLVQEPYSKLAKLLATSAPLDETVINTLIEQIKRAEAELKPATIIQPDIEQPLFNDSEEAQQQLDNAFLSVLRESRIGLEQAKESIIEFVATQWNHSCLSDVPALLREVRGSLNMIPLKRAANIIESCERYIKEVLLANQQVPEWQMLDTLADAITSIDYYLERLIDDPESDAAGILAVAAESVAELGYPIEDASKPVLLAAEDHPAEPDTTSATEIEPPTLEAIEEVVAPTLAPVIPLRKPVADLAPVEETISQQPTAEAENIELETNEPEIDVEPPLLETEQPETTAAASDEPIEDEDYDPEIVEIFIEEAGEVLETINEYLPQWVADQNNHEARAEVRRAFHTLKGSGRMVGAVDIGELAWSIENMLNRVLDGSINMDEHRFALVKKVTDRVPALVTAFEQRHSVDKNELAELIAQAELLAKEQNPTFEEATTTLSPATESESDAEQAALTADDTIPILDQTVDATTEDETDNELISIFITEAETHSQTLQQFIDYCRELSAPAELTDELQRALHTLKGSANMAGVTPIADVVAHVERLVRELRTSQFKADEPVVTLLEEGHAFIRIGIDQLHTNPLQPLPNVDDYEQRLAEFLEQRLAEVTSSSSEETGIAPDALNQFLANSYDQLAIISDKLDAVRNGSSLPESFADSVTLLEQFIDHAESVNQSAPAELGEAMEVFYRDASHIDQQALNEQFYLLAGNGNDTLIDMLDQIAGHQTPVYSTQLLSDLQDFEFPIEPSPESEMAPATTVEEDNFSVPTLELGDEIILDASALEQTLQMPAVSESALDLQFLTEESQENDDAIDLDLDSIISETEQQPETSTDVVDDETIIAAMTDFAAAISTENDYLEDSQQQQEPEPEFELEIEEPVTQQPEHVASTESHPEPIVATTSSDDDIDDEIVEIFLEEADDLLENLDETIQSWNDDRDNRAHLDDLLRILHTLKGGARLAGLKQMGDFSHNFETYLIDFDNSRAPVTDELLSSVQSLQDGLITQLQAIKSGEKPEPISIPEPAPVIEQPPQKTETTTSKMVEQSAVEPEESFDLDLDAEVAADEKPPVEPQPKPKTAEVVPFKGPSPRQVSADRIDTPAIDLGNKKGPQEVIKISAQLLENLVNLAGETSISRSRAEEQISELVFSLDEMQITVERLQEQVRRLDMETEAQILYRQEQVESVGIEGFDPLEMDRYSQLQQLSRSLLESSSDLTDIKNTLYDKSRDMETLLVQQSRINTELQEGLMRSRMVPFSRMVPRLRRIVRQVSSELNKKVDFHLENVEGELDRTVLERMVAPLEHMLRNAIDHGIEMPDTREAAGKPSRGNITLGLAREGGEIVITLHDDGGGIDLAVVRKKAVERGLMEANAQLADQEVLQFILQSGFSTATKVTQISGRGVGMDVVHSEIKQLGGAMQIDSKLGVGTTFTVRLPFTVSINRALMVNIGGDIYAIPLNTIEGIVRVSPFELEAYYQPDAPMFEYAGQPYLLRYMGALLHRGEKPNLEGQTMPLPVVLVRGSDHSVAVQVDSLLGSREIVVKPLGPQFGMVHGLSGATVLGDGSVVVILDLLALIRADASHLHRDLALGHDGSANKEQNILVMVVDDSVTVRKVTSRLLERQGMEVITAKDGVDAVTQLQEMERLPSVILLDIEMPRMDGFEVANRVKHNSRLQQIPIIMITSRTGEKHRERALSIGVEEYMGKPYQESKLLDTIHSLLGVTV